MIGKMPKSELQNNKAKMMTKEQELDKSVPDLHPSLNVNRKIPQPDSEFFNE